MKSGAKRSVSAFLSFLLFFQKQKNNDNGWWVGTGKTDSGLQREFVCGRKPGLVGAQVVVLIF